MEAKFNLLEQCLQTCEIKVGTEIAILLKVIGIHSDRKGIRDKYILETHLLDVLYYFWK